MARSLPVENLLVYYHRMWVQLSTTCSNLLNGELLVAVDHNQLRIMASETVDPIDWSHPLVPLPYTGQYPLSSACYTVQCGLQITRLTALTEMQTCDLGNARPMHCLCSHSGYNVLQWCNPGLEKVPISPWLATLLHISGVTPTPQLPVTPRDRRCLRIERISLYRMTSARSPTSPRQVPTSPHRAPISSHRMMSVRMFHDVSHCFKSVSWCFTSGSWCFTSGLRCITMFNMCFMMFYYV